MTGNGSPASALLWDLDGVIVASGRYHFEAYRWLAARYGVEISEGRFFADLFGRRNADIIRDLFGDVPPAEARRLAEEKEARFRELVRGQIEPLPGAVALLRRAHDAGLKQAIVSSTPRANIALIADSLAINGLLDAVVGEEDSERGKPDPAPFTTAAGRLGVPHGACIVIEDAPEGIEGGKSAGMRVIGVATTRPPERLLRADLVVDSLEDPCVWAFIRG